MRARFPGSEPYDADEYATNALMRDGDDGGAGTGVAARKKTRRNKLHSRRRR
jgi:hypothetical protein